MFSRECMCKNASCKPFCFASNELSVSGFGCGAYCSGSKLWSGVVCGDFSGSVSSSSLLIDCWFSIQRLFFEEYTSSEASC